jgi:prepilin-type N-terminal cleavage/methylation domain-containing protein
MRSKKGFTLIELLVVIGILAILMTVTIIALNPAELLKQSRDASRVSDLAALRAALNLYVSTVASPDMNAADTDADCYLPTAGGDCYLSQSSGTCDTAGRSSSTVEVIDADTTIDGTGWVPVNFTAISGGSPLHALPVDPINNAAYYYTYSCNNTDYTYELTADLESTRYSKNGSTDLESNSQDGGNMDNIYEVGTEPGLDL